MGFVLSKIFYKLFGEKNLRILILGKYCARLILHS